MDTNEILDRSLVIVQRLTGFIKDCLKDGFTSRELAGHFAFASSELANDMSVSEREELVGKMREFADDIEASDDRQA